MLAFFKSENTAQSESSWLKTVAFFRDLGYESSLHVINSCVSAARLRMPLAERWSKRFQRKVAYVNALSTLSRLPQKSICWCVGAPIQNLKFEQQIKRCGHTYIFNLLDDWLSIPALRDAAVARIQLADLIAVPTANLQHVILSEFPKAKVEIFDEVVDVDAIRPFRVKDLVSAPHVVWNGRQTNIPKLESLAYPLQVAYQRTQFTLVVACEKHPPQLNLPIPFHWEPFDHVNEAQLMAGARCGLDPVGNTRYESCKGNYKVKVYLAAGIPVVASPIGINQKLIEPRKNGFLPANKEEWADVIVSLVSDVNLYTEMSKNARQFSLDYLAHHVVIPSWIDKLKQHNFI